MQDINVNSDQIVSQVHTLLHAQNVDGGWSNAALGCELEREQFPERASGERAEMQSSPIKTGAVLNFFGALLAQRASSPLWPHIRRRLQAPICRALDFLAVAQEPSGEWQSDDHRSSIIDTAIVLQGVLWFVIDHDTACSLAKHAVKWLQGNQCPEGNWTDNAGDSLQPTAFVTSILLKFETRSTPYIAKALEWLEKNKTSPTSAATVNTQSTNAAVTAASEFFSSCAWPQTSPLSHSTIDPEESIYGHKNHLTPKIRSIVAPRDVLVFARSQRLDISWWLNFAAALRGCRIRIATSLHNRTQVLQAGFEMYDLGEDPSCSTCQSFPARSCARGRYSDLHSFLCEVCERHRRRYSAGFDCTHRHTKVQGSSRPFFADLVIAGSDDFARKWAFEAAARVQAPCVIIPEAMCGKIVQNHTSHAFTRQRTTDSKFAFLNFLTSYPLRCTSPFRPSRNELYQISTSSLSTEKLLPINNEASTIALQASTILKAFETTPESSSNCSIFPSLRASWTHILSGQKLSGAAAAGLIVAGALDWEDLTMCTFEPNEFSQQSSWITEVCADTLPLLTLFFKGFLLLASFLTSLPSTQMEGLGDLREADEKCARLRDPARKARVEQARFDYGLICGGEGVEGEEWKEELMGCWREIMAADLRERLL